MLQDHSLEKPWGALGRLGSALCVFWAALGPSWCVVGPSLGSAVLGVFWVGGGTS